MTRLERLHGIDLPDLLLLDVEMNLIELQSNPAIQDLHQFGRKFYWV
jgi:hypothetical protein